MYRGLFSVLMTVVFTISQSIADEPAKAGWKYRPELLRPFWYGEIIEGESVLFIQTEKPGSGKGSVLFPIFEILSVRNSAGDMTYENGKDFVWEVGSREIVIPADSRIPTRSPADLRRPAKSQPYQLTHRDGNGEIFFGGRLEYAEMQTCITYRHAPDMWKSTLPKFDPKALPKTVARLVNKQPLSMVVIGDSISAGANASGLFDAAPYQPPYPGALRTHLEHRFGGKVELVNRSVGGTDSAWALGRIDAIVEPRPNVVIIAFGMNDAAGRPAADYQANIVKLIESIREQLPECEFILIAPMLGNRDWIHLKADLFPQYRDKLLELAAPGVAVADLTSVWDAFLELKQDWDLTGNGVNHPNDFGHRVYAQVISVLLDPSAAP